MKKIIIYTSLIGFIVAIIFKNRIDHYIENEKNNQSSWTTYIKRKNTIYKHKTTKDELKKIGVLGNNVNNNISNQKISRSPAKVKKIMPKSGSHQNRKIIGSSTTDFDQLNYINLISKDWKDKLSEKLLKYRDRPAKLIIQSENSIIKIVHGNARYLEQVNISFLFKGDDRNSFKAFVDSETGEVLQTWSRSIHDRVGDNQMTIIPDGTL